MGDRRLLLAFAACLWAGLAVAQTRVFGRVLDENGQPVAGATLLHDVPGGEATAGGTSDAQGFFAAPLPAEPTVAEPASRLWLGATGRGGASIALLRPTDGELPPLVLEKGITLVGRVRGSDGRPLAGARVRATSLRRGTHGGWELDGRTTTEASGIFKLAGMPRSNLRLVVEADGYLRKSLAPVAHGAPLEVDLQPGGTIAGTVVAPDGAPSQALVQIAWENETEVQHVVTDAAGRFSANWLLPVHCRIRATAMGAPKLASGPASGAARSTVPTAPTRAGTGTRTGPLLPMAAVTAVLTAPANDLQLRLRPVAEQPTLRVRATGDGGAPLTEFAAAVSWSGDKQPDEIVWNAFAREHGAAVGGVACCAAPDATHGEQTGVLLVVAPGRAFAFTTVVWQPAADGGMDIAVATVPGRKLEGHVVDAAGGAVAGARVWARRDFETNWELDGTSPYGVHATTGADGSFQLPQLGVARWHIHAARPGQMEPKSRRLDLVDGDDPKPMRIVLPAVANVKGRVVGLAPGQSLGFLPATAKEEHADNLLFPRCWSAADGAFAVADVPVGNVTVVVIQPRGVAAGPPLVMPLRVVRVGREGVDDLQLDATEVTPATLRGRVDCTAAAVPPDRLLVQVRTEAARAIPRLDWYWEGIGWDVVAFVAADGTFSVPVAPGQHHVRVVDALTGTVLAQHDKQNVAAGATKSFALAVEAGVLELELVPAPVDEAGPGFMLAYERGGSDHFHWLQPGLALGDSLLSPLLYLPLGNGTLRLGTGTLSQPNVLGRLGPAHLPYVDPNSPATEFEVEAGNVCRVQMAVPRRQ